MSITSKFIFIGEANIPKKVIEGEEKFAKEWFGGAKGKTPCASLRFSIMEKQNNRAFVELFGVKSDNIFTKDTEGNNIEIAWNDRFQPESLSAVAFYRKTIVDLGEEFGGRKEFINNYDAILHLAEYLPQYKGRIMVRGVWKKNLYNNKISDKYEITSVEAVNDDVKPRLSLTMDFFYNADSIDKSNFKESSKIIINGYVAQYIDKESGTQYIPQSAVLSAEKYNMDNPQHVDKWKYKEQYVSNSNLTSKKMYHLTWECRLVNGAEEIEFDESMLTPKQKEQIKFGVRELADFAPKGGSFGEKITEVRLFDPILTKNFADGLIECDEKLKEFEEKIFTFSVIEKFDEVVTNTPMSTEPESANHDEDDDLF